MGGEGEGTHRYCGDICVDFIEKTNPKGDVHHVCVTADGRLLDGNTGASRANIFLQPYCKKKDANGECILKSAWAIVGYEESKGVGIPPEGDHDDDDPCGTDDGTDDGLDDHDLTAEEGIRRDGTA